MNTATRGAAVAALLGLCLAPGAEAVVNGTTVTTAEFQRDFPWVVALLSPDKTGQVCGATLISPTWLVTAGHCANPDLTAQIGNPERRTGRQVRIAAAIVHPRYQKAGLYDIGLIRLPEPVRIKPLRIATLVESRRALATGAPAVILGWGRRAASGGFSEELAAARITLGPTELRDTLFLYRDLHAGVCAGDSGGPMVIKDAAGKPVLLGIADVTDGDLCAKGGGIAGYTEVAQLLDFITANVTDLPGRVSAPARAAPR